jgi:hypothetical protein
MGIVSVWHVAVGGSGERFGTGCFTCTSGKCNGGSGWVHEGSAAYGNSTMCSWLLGRGTAQRGNRNRFGNRHCLVSRSEPSGDYSQAWVVCPRL